MPLQYIPMPRNVETSRLEKWTRFSSVAAWIGIFVGCLVLTGWAIGIRELITMLPNYNSMKPNTALGFILSGLALFLLQSRKGKRKPDSIRLLSAHVLALLVFSIGLISLIETFGTLDLRIDQALFRDTLTDPRFSVPGRMSIATAFGFTMLGLSLIFLARRTSFDASLSQLFALVALGDSMIGCLGYMYGGRTLYHVTAYTTMAIHTSLLFILVALGILAARPDKGMVAVLTNPLAGGQMARRILPLAVTAPFLIGWLRLLGQQAGWYGTEFGLALTTASTIIFFTALIWSSAQLINARDLEIRHGHQEFHTMLDTIPQLAWMAHADGFIFWYNQRWYEYTGTTPAQMEGWGWQSVHDPKVLPMVMEKWKKSIATGQSFEMEFPLLGADGSFRWFLTRVHPFKDADDKILRWFGTNTDISEKRDAAEKIRRLNTSLEQRVEQRTSELALANARFHAVLNAATHYSIIATDRDGVISIFNKGAEKMLGYKAEEMVGKQTPRILHLESEIIARGQELSQEYGRPVEGFDVFVEKAKRGEFDDREWTYVRKDGRKLTVNLVVTAKLDDKGNIRGFLGVATDITARLQAEQELRAFARRLSLATHTLQGGIWDWDISTNSIIWDEKMREIYGFSSDGPVDYQLWADAVVPDDLPQAAAILQETVAAKSQSISEFRIKKTDGSVRYIHATQGVLLDAQGNVNRVIGVNMDVTAQKGSEEVLRQSEQRFSNAFEHATTGMALVSLEGQFLKVNESVCRMLGYTAEELTSLTFQNITHPSDLGVDLENVRKLVNDELKYYKMEKRYLHKTGQVIWALLGVSLLRDKHNKPLYFISQIEDISEIKQTMTQLQELTQKAQTAERAKTNFLANMSHEIRTPMNGVIGMTELLLDTKLDDMQRDSAQTIMSSAQSLLSLLNDILDLSKLEADKMSCEEIDFDLRDLLEDSLSSLAAQAQAKGLELVGSLERGIITTLKGDPRRLKQVLVNLIGNAIKFTKQGEVSVKISKEVQTGHEIHLRYAIEDTGLGISSETLSHLFQPFEQGDNSTSRRFGGSGLGLAISKRLVEAMKGEIRVKSILGQGSEFWFTARHPLPLAAHLPSENLPSFTGTRVLIVDDNESSRKALQQQLLDWEMHVDCSSKGKDALVLLRDKAAQKKPYHLVLVDLEMPEMDGISLARQIGEDALLRPLKIILLVPFGRQFSSTELDRLPFSESCVKPIRQAALLHSINSVLGRTPKSKMDVSEPDEKSFASRNQRILIAEDNLVNQKVALSHLTRLGYKEIDIAENGIEVLESLKSKFYDIIFMDCHMPEMDGYRATHEIRLKEPNRSVWIIAMTANAMEGDSTKCLTAGMDDYLSKPFTRRNLILTLERYYKQRMNSCRSISHDVDESSSKGFLQLLPSQSGTTPISRKTIGKLDDEVMIDLTGGLDSTLKEIVDAFVATAPKLITKMRSAMENNNGKDLYMAAHALKGNCCIFGPQPIVQSCDQIQQATKSNKLENASQLVLAAENELKELIDVLQAYHLPNLELLA